MISDGFVVSASVNKLSPWNDIVPELYKTTVMMFESGSLTAVFIGTERNPSESSTASDTLVCVYNEQGFNDASSDVVHSYSIVKAIRDCLIDYNEARTQS